MPANQPAKRRSSRLSSLEEHAACLLAAGRPLHEVAAEVQMQPATISKWRQRPAFAAYEEAQAERIRAAIRARGITEKSNRIDALNERWDAMRQLISERGADPSMADVPGGSTGLLVRDYKQLGKRTLPVYKADTELLRELRQTEQQAAQELGQWTTQHETTQSGRIVFSILPDGPQNRDDTDIIDAEVTHSLPAPEDG